MRQTRWLARGGFACATVLVLVGCGSGQEEMARRVFESRVARVSVNVERNEVHVFGSDQTSGAVIDRWTQSGDAYRELGEAQDGDRVDVVASCERSGECRARYDLALAKSTLVDVAMQQGNLGLYHLGSEVRATVGQGSIVGKHITARHVELGLGRGRIDVIMADRPELLVVRIDEGRVNLVMPPGRYRCEFDRFDEAIHLNGLDCHGRMAQGIRLELGKGAYVTFKSNVNYVGPTP
ncbi:hypothetical protein DV096_05940 [Bradymonadaceae bacterium TMQ3]|uniref:Adhesin domain-containing protein n=1 Tax=Lujinxingia sediminis TaxID=2480984 RepID=A0ABY0CW91_9DELT|nr:hypothetical protein [Lujinxingia sediminis]RDV40098.1 hypothetical protein DV096_05940 [Bradymonadaceae bacterium TMQ3]RVU47854.1 hypothetical protein EA187_00005 [Lujinxingia sediminis]TXC77157.1 hypothetical protein FRC91_00005 [Bradymonadales bacterium TMQ1]